MPARVSLFAVVILTGLAEIASAESNCVPDLVLTEDATVSRWVICQQGRELQFAASGAVLDLMVSDDSGRAVQGFTWTRVDGDAGQFVFHGRNERLGISLIRSFQPVSSAKVRHTVRLDADATAQAENLTILMEAGMEADDSSGTARSLADYVYGFSRVFVIDDAGQWVEVRGRAETHAVAYTVRHKLLLTRSGSKFHVNESTGDVSSGQDVSGFGQRRVAISAGNEVRAPTAGIELTTSAFPMSAEVLTEVDLDDLLYAYLWAPLAQLCLLIEFLLSELAGVIGGAGPAVLVLAVTIRLITYPVNAWSANAHRKYLTIAEEIKPKIAAIREQFKGAEQSERILGIYHEYGISPFTSLKGSVGFLLQIPFLLAFFHVTTVSAIFAGETFLWVRDLSDADALIELASSVPLLGHSINLLPLMLGAMNIIFSDSTQVSSGSGRIASVVVSVLIVLFFYSFSAALVLYWLTINAMQVIERRLQALVNQSQTIQTGLH